MSSYVVDTALQSAHKLIYQNELAARIQNEIN